MNRPALARQKARSRRSRAGCRRGRRRTQFLPRRLLVLAIAVLVPIGAAAQQQGDTPPPLNIIGLTGLSFGAWTEPDTKMEDWVQMARFVCQAEEFCKINVFDGPELATHVDPVPEENRKALKYVFTYQQGETPPIVVREAQPEEGKEPREWTFD